MDILSEVERNLVENGLTSAFGARHLIATLREIFPEAEVTGYEQLIPSMLNDEKDRHVLAAAVVAGAQTIATDNIVDVPEDALAPFGIEAPSPDEFLTHQFHLEPSTMARIVVEQAEDLKTPPMSVDQLLAVLSRHVPTFAMLAGVWLADRR